LGGLASPSQDCVPLKLAHAKTCAIKDLRAAEVQERTIVRSQRSAIGRRQQHGFAPLTEKGADMPSYQNVTPPLSLFSGDVGFSFNNETFPGSAQAGTQFALPSFTGLPDGGTSVRWQTIFGGAPTAVNIVLQGAMSDVDAEYFLIDTTTITGGEARTVANVQAKFIRIKFISSTGGSGLTAKVQV
jgi:hypothetical protein